MGLFKIKMVRVDGIEPTTSAWKADVLPLNYTRVIEARKMPPSPPLGQDRNSEKTPFFTPHSPFLKLLPQLSCGHRDNAPHLKLHCAPSSPTSGLRSQNPSSGNGIGTLLFCSSMKSCRINAAARESISPLRRSSFFFCCFSPCSTE